MWRWLPAAPVATATARLNKNRNHSTGFDGSSDFLRASSRTGERRACGTAVVSVYSAVRPCRGGVGLVRVMRAPVVLEGRPAPSVMTGSCLLESGNHIMVT